MKSFKNELHFICRKHVLFETFDEIKGENGCRIEEKKKDLKYFSFSLNESNSVYSSENILNSI